MNRSLKNPSGAGMYKWRRVQLYDIPHVCWSQHNGASVFCLLLGDDLSGGVLLDSWFLASENWELRIENIFHHHTHTHSPSPSLWVSYTNHKHKDKERGLTLGVVLISAGDLLVLWPCKGVSSSESSSTMPMYKQPPRALGTILNILRRCSGG